MGLCCDIRERLSSRSFYFLSDLVLAAEAMEKLLEREKTMKWKPQTLQNNTTDDVKYRGVSDSAREYGSSMPSQSMPVDFSHVIKNSDYVSRREEEKPK